MPHASPKRHGELKHVLVDDDLFLEMPQVGNGFKLERSSGFLAAPADNKDPLATSLAGVPPEGLFRFGRMFRRPNLPEFRPDREDLVKLGLAMKEEVDPGVNRNLPAGYTLLGQFIDHDITFDPTEELPYGAVEAESVESKRSPSLDLDSLYGLEKSKDPNLVHVYEANKTNLAFGPTVIDPFVSPEVTATYPNDLPRGLDPCQPKAMAMTADSRNDENLAIAQTHLAFVKFHNAVVKVLKNSNVPLEDLFEKARELVVKHYQSIILDDYLPRILHIDKKKTPILNDVIDNGCRHFVFKEKEEPFMPVEFSVAAFRLGHAMVTETLEWNRYFQTSPGSNPARSPATMSQLFTFTGSHGNNFLTLNRLPGSWVIDWTRFFDFPKSATPSQKPKSYARKICPSIVSSLAELPIPAKDPAHRSLAVRNLLRGRLLGLPTGQSVAERLGIIPLQPHEIANGPHRHHHDQILKSCGFDRLTPLWYYILRESEFYHQGDRLGPVGSWIVAETFVRLIKSSSTSILPKDRNGRLPFPSDLTTTGKYSMPDLLDFVDKNHKGENFLNPLGD